MRLYVASLICGVAYVVSRIVGEPVTILALACFLLGVIAIVTDKSLRAS